MSRGVGLSTPINLHRAGLDALVAALGAVDAIRFIRLFDNGYGDYTKERHAIYAKMSVNDIWDDMKKFEEE